MLKRGSFTSQVVWGLYANAKKSLYIVHLEINPSKKKDHRQIKKQKIEVYKSLLEVKQDLKLAPALRLSLSFGKTSKLFLFFVASFLFVLTFSEMLFQNLLLPDKCNYATIEGIKQSPGSVLISLNGLGYINTEPIIFICSYI